MPSSDSSIEAECRCGLGEQCGVCFDSKGPGEPPLTPEEEEEAGCACGEPDQPGTVHRTDGPCYLAPPQPERRPPLAYAYSVQGHLYEVALSGDATIVAQDGALIITHALGPVAGIVQARPMEGEQN